jgi:hypothetical protein
MPPLFLPIKRPFQRQDRVVWKMCADCDVPKILANQRRVRSYWSDGSSKWNWIAATCASWNERENGSTSDPCVSRFCLLTRHSKCILIPILLFYTNTIGNGIAVAIFIVISFVIGIATSVYVRGKCVNYFVAGTYSV